MSAQLLESHGPGDMPWVSVQMAQELAASVGVCARRIIRRVMDCETGAGQLVGIPCGSTRESRCPACAHKARVLRMQQCAEGWHLTHEPDTGGHDDQADCDNAVPDENNGRHVRSTKRRDDSPDLPRVPVEDRTVGHVFTSPDGRREYRPSMFLTLTLPSYGPISDGAPVDPANYDYRRAALDAVLFPRLVDRFFQNLRRCAGFKVQYFSAVEAQHRLAPHLHAAIRGAIPRQTLRRVIRATYLQVWWPPFDTPTYSYRLPRWDGTAYVDPDTGRPLPNWDQALADLDADDSAPVHVMRFGRQYDMQGIIAPSTQADRAVKYLTKYLTKAISDTHHPDPQTALAYERHIDRLHAELRYLPCSPRCANWLRYGTQPSEPGPGLVPGRCTGKAHDRENLGLGGRRVLVSRHWSGKTLTRHRADRASVVRETLLAAGFEPPQVDRLAADATTTDGQLRYRWSDVRPDARTYTRVLLTDIAEHQTWKAQYQAAKTRIAAVDSNSATTSHGPAP